MSKVIVPLDTLGAEDRRRFKQLTSAPPIAWPTAILAVVLSVTYVGVYLVCGTGHAPLWAGTLINTAIGYVSFSVAHDSIHRAISSNTRLNDAIGQIGMTLVLPYVDLRMFRWAHILHHRFASGERDPDKSFRGHWSSLPFRWMLIDAFYFVYSLKNADKVSGPYLRRSLQYFAVVLTVVVALIWAGYGAEVLMLWFLPSRLILLILGFSFFWLPHLPHDVSQEENFTRATTVRFGYESLLGPVMQYQNYHLIHHLYPMTPFYNNYKVWQLLEPELRKKDLAIQHGLSLHPEIRLAQATGS
ncbi:MAG: fatty acid desaturase [Panacagrimonas sp.]